KDQDMGQAQQGMGQAQVQEDLSALLEPLFDGSLTDSAPSVSTPVTLAPSSISASQDSAETLGLSNLVISQASEIAHLKALVLRQNEEIHELKAQISRQRTIIDELQGLASGHTSNEGW
ncbi:hypothetical protein HDU76_009757, partial [Blyttiomyces sp. JEL0837]